jgi:anti-anti-sigma regulatory factor
MTISVSDYIEALPPKVDELHVQAHRGGDVCVIRLNGSLFASTSNVMEGLVDLVSTWPSRSGIVDASMLQEIDRAGISSIRQLQRHFERLGGTMIVYAASGDVARALDESHLTQ